LRQIVLTFQRELAKNKGYVVCGRDITFKVLPEAEVKVFLDAGLEARARRRRAQLQKEKIFLPLSEVEKDLKERDQRDQANISQAQANSFKIDASNLKKTEIVKKICELLKANHHFYKNGKAYK
jgi:CMP/dCMP kinase